MHLDHTIVPAKDKEASARFFARIMGLTYDGAKGHFAPVRVGDGLTMDFDDRDAFESHHYAFHITEAEFDGIFARVKEEKLKYGSGPGSHENMEINCEARTWSGGAMAGRDSCEARRAATQSVDDPAEVEESVGNQPGREDGHLRTMGVAVS